MAPLLPYATANLLLHAEAAQRCGITQAPLLATLQTLNGQVNPVYLLAHNCCQEYQVRRYKPEVTILYVATERDLSALTSLILTSENYSVNITCGWYGNVLQAACHNGNEEIVRSLQEAGADVNSRAGLNGNALTIAAYCGDEQTVQLLLDRGANVNDLGGGCYTSALAAASDYGSKEIVQILLEKGAYVNAQDGALRPSALYFASCLGHEQVVQMLLNAGADVNAATGSYGKALIAASVAGWKTTVQTLISRGADVSFVGPYGSALGVATKEGHEEVAQILRAAVTNH